MTTPQWEPERLEVGLVCRVERHYCFARKNDKPIHSWTRAITNITPKRAYMGQDWFAIDDHNRIVKPQYLDYTTRVVRIEPKGEG